jgi:hypothetical protein
MLLLGIVYAVGLQIIGLEVGLIIGMIAGLASIIPYLGFGVGIIAAVIASLFQFGLDWMQLLLVGIVFMIGQMVEGYILQPFLLGDKIGLSPVAVVFAVLAGAQFRVGDGYGYVPSASATALQGNTLYTGAPSNYIVQSDNSVVYTLLIDTNVGDFNFGEIGLYLDT